MCLLKGFSTPSANISLLLWHTCANRFISLFYSLPLQIMPTLPWNLCHCPCHFFPPQSSKIPLLRSQTLFSFRFLQLSVNQIHVPSLFRLHFSVSCQTISSTASLFRSFWSRRISLSSVDSLSPSLRLTRHPLHGKRETSSCFPLKENQESSETFPPQKETRRQKKREEQTKASKAPLPQK